MKRRNFLSACGAICASPVMVKANEKIHAKEQGRGRLTECFIKGRPGDSGPMFEGTKQGDVICNLHRYAIIPREEYEELVKQRDEQKEEVGSWQSCDFEKQQPAPREPLPTYPC